MASWKWYEIRGDVVSGYLKSRIPVLARRVETTSRRRGEFKERRRPPRCPVKPGSTPSSGIRDRIRELIEELVEQKRATALRRARYERGGSSGHHPSGSAEVRTEPV